MLQGGGDKLQEYQDGMDPHSTYKEKLGIYDKRLQSERRREDWCANTRFVLFVLTLITGWWFYKGEAEHILPSLIPFGLFVAVATLHAGILRKIGELELGRIHFQNGLDRLSVGPRS